MVELIIEGLISYLRLPPQALINATTRTGPAPFPKSSARLKTANALPLVSGVHTFCGSGGKVTTNGDYILYQHLLETYTHMMHVRVVTCSTERTFGPLIETMSPANNDTK